VQPSQEENPEGWDTDTWKALEALESFVDNNDLLELESLIGRFNIFDALGIKDFEIRHSNFLAFLLDPSESHGSGPLFLKAVLMDLLKKARQQARPVPVSPVELDGAELRGVDVRRERNHIDLLILCKEPPFAVVIENKIWAEEGTDQLTDYEMAMQQQYPEYRALYVYVTRNRDKPSRDNWMPYSHADIYHVLKRVRETYRKGIGDDVLVFLDHYLNLIGTRFMNDTQESKRIDELCQRIYKNHRQALDLIRERVRGSSSGVLAAVKSVLEEDGRRWDFHVRSSYIFFMPKAWLEWLPQFGVGVFDHRWWIHGSFNVEPGKLTFYLYVGPMTDFEKRKVIVTQLLQEIPACGFKRAQSRPLKNNWSLLAAAEAILDWHEGDEPDVEEARKKVKTSLDELYPKLEKLEPVLKRLADLPTEGM
jgi:hypothetical protein